MSTKKTICLNMIVKDESHVIMDTLHNLWSYIQFDTYVVSDTGSSDNTKALIKAFFDEKGVSGELTDDAWKDFGHNRTVAFNHAYNKSDYVFVWDADDRIKGDFKLPTPLTADSYSFSFGSYSRRQLFNNRKRWKYVGVLHECPTCCEQEGREEKVVGSYQFESNRTGARNKDPLKYLKDGQILEKAFYEALEAKDSIHTRYAYYCANSYNCTSTHKDKAIEFYKKVLTLDNWHQEKYNSCIELFQIHEQQGKAQEALHWLVESHKYDKTRIEGIFRLIRHYCSNQPEVAFAYYTLVQNYVENRYLTDNIAIKLFVKNSEYEFYLPYYMIIVSDRVKRKEVGAKMFEILFRKAHVPGEWWTRNVFTNIQFFLEHLPKTSEFFLSMTNYFDACKRAGHTFTEVHYQIMDKVLVKAKPVLGSLSPPDGNRAKALKDRGVPENVRVMFTVTTCKRLDLFVKTMASILKCWTDLEKVDYFYCVDDNSSEEDREVMRQSFPFFDYLMKGPEQRGHMKSMNLIWNRLKEVKPTYWIHMEDDWLFFKQEAYVARAIKVLESYKGENIHQVVFNKNYGLMMADIERTGGRMLDATTRLHIKIDQQPGRHAGFWPHYSLQPSMCRAETILALGDYTTANKFFERDYANKYFAKGFQTAFFEGIYSLHIGKQHWETEGQNAYALNAESQFNWQSSPTKLENDQSEKPGEKPVINTNQVIQPEPESHTIIEQKEEEQKWQAITYPKFHGTMGEHLDQLKGLMVQKVPFALIRPSDGEYSVIKGQTLTNCDKWTFQAGGKLQADLTEAVQTDSSGLYIGIPCNTCNKPWNCTQKIYDDYKALLKSENITYANIFMNANWPTFVTLLKEDTRPLYVVTSGRTGTTELQIRGRHIIDPFLVNKWDTEGLKETAKILDFVKTKTNALICFSAGPLSKVWIPKCWAANPTNTYLDVGAALDPFSKGPEVKSRFYTDRGHPFAKEACQFQESQSNKTLVYMSVFHDKRYVEMLRLLLFSIKYNVKELTNVDILILTEKALEPSIQNISTLLDIPFHIYLLEGVKTASEASTTKLNIFEYPNIHKYNRLLYLDTDIIIQHDISPLFTEPLEDRLYAVEEGIIGEAFHGSWFFDFNKIKRNTPAFNAGVFLILNTTTMNGIFKDVLNYMNKSILNKHQMAPCYEQPYLNYFTISNSRQDTTFMKQYIKLDNPLRISPKPREEMPIIHYICNESHGELPKQTRMERDLSRQLFTNTIIDTPTANPVLGKTYAWHKGIITFEEEGLLITTWGKGTYRWLTSSIIEASWSGIYHHLYFNETTMECLSIRKGDCQMIRLTPIKLKSLIYMCVFYNKNYIQLLNLLLLSAKMYSSFENMDILIITSKEFESDIEALAANISVPIRTMSLSIDTIFQAACARLSIFKYLNMTYYDKILYLDTDILIKGDLSRLFNIPLDDKLYALESGFTDSINFGVQFFDPPCKITGLNSGTLLFRNTPTMKALFQRIREHVEAYTKSGSTPPYALDQPFINYHAIKDNLYNNQALKPFVALFEDGIPENEASAIICHFSFPIGNFPHKFYRMKNYFNELLLKESDTKNPMDLIGRSYSWNTGFIKFQSTNLQTTWGQGIYKQLDSERVLVSWNGFSHVLRFREDKTSWFCVRLHDFVACNGYYIATPSIQFDETKVTPLCEIMGKHGSDKGSKDITKSWHNYTTLYYSLLKDKQQTVKRVFELGIGTTDTSIPNNMGVNGKPGASLRGWAEFFPLAQVFGADIDKRILFTEDRIKTYYCDQLNPIAIKGMWLNKDLVEGFDLILDDGLHRYDANICFLENSIHKLNPGGIYIIEDINNHNLGKLNEKLDEFKKVHPNLQYNLVTLPSTVNKIDNRVLVITK